MDCTGANSGTFGCMMSNMGSMGGTFFHDFSPGFSLLFMILLAAVVILVFVAIRQLSE
jgi:NADH:ubiquinone oxidoreductase subunit 6 (subunit J)